MIATEKKLRESILKNMGLILPGVFTFISIFVLTGNEWGAALLSIIMAVPFIKFNWNGMGLLWWGIALIVLAGIVNENFYAVTAYWLITAGLVILAFAHFRRG